MNRKRRMILMCSTSGGVAGGVSSCLATALDLPLGQAVVTALVVGVVVGLVVSVSLGLLLPGGTTREDNARSRGRGADRGGADGGTG